MNNQTSHKISSLIQCYQRFTPMEAFQWKKTSVSVIKLKIKLTKRILTTIELRKLIKRKTPTNDVMHFIKHIKSKYHRNRMMHSMMTQKLKNAVYMESKIRKQYETVYVEKMGNPARIFAIPI